VQQLQHDGKRIVILTSAAGASRVFELQDERFVRWQDELHVVDEAGRVWRVAEDALVTAGGAMRRPRIAAHRVFWFAWYAQYPETVLVR
jgi:hypothetical protein